jgi:hypothetical protein
VWQHAWVRFPPSSFLIVLARPGCSFAHWGVAYVKTRRLVWFWGRGDAWTVREGGARGGDTDLSRPRLLLVVVLHLVAASCACDARGSGPLAVCRGREGAEVGTRVGARPSTGRSPGGSALSAVARPSCSARQGSRRRHSRSRVAARSPSLDASSHGRLVWGAAIGAADVHGNTAATSTRAASVAPPPSSQRCSRQRRDHRRDMCHGRRHAADAGLRQGPRGSRRPPPRLRQRGHNTMDGQERQTALALTDMTLRHGCGTTARRCLWPRRRDCGRAAAVEGGAGRGAVGDWERGGRWRRGQRREGRVVFGRSCTGLSAQPVCVGEPTGEG